MAVQLSLDRCGVILVGHNQCGTAPGPQPQKGPTNATDCGSDPLLMAGAGQSRATGHQTLRIVHWNVEGVRQKKLELQQFLKAQKIDVYHIQETHLNNMHRFCIRGYEIHRVDRADRPKGGVLTLVKTSIPSTEVQRSKKADTEYITVKLILPDRNLTICNVYSLPSKAISLQILQPNSEDFNFNSAVLKAAKESIPRGRWHDYKPYWNNTSEKIHKELSEAREEMERNPTPQNVRGHSQLKVDLDKEKQTQTQASWKTKTASLNVERDSQKLWQLTKSLNGDNSERGRTTLQTTNGAVTGKAAANVLARVFEEESTALPSVDRVKDVRTQTRAVLQNSASAGFDPCMTECLTLRELEEALKKMKQKAPGPDGITNEILKHLGPGAKRTLLRIYNQSWSTGTVATIWKEAVIRPIPKKGKRQTRSFQLPPNQSAELCWKASGEDYQQKAHMAS